MSVPSNNRETGSEPISEMERDELVFEELPAEHSANGITDLMSTNFSKLSQDWRQRVKASLTNARYNLTSVTKSVFSEKSPICLFGRLYCPIDAISHSESDHSPPDSEVLLPFSAFTYAFSRIYWFTYRRGFEIPVAEKYDTDCGWGCMLRCGQMLLARALFLHNRGADAPPDDELDRALLARFVEDSASHRPPFSLHRLVELGAALCGSRAGEWFAPGATARVLSAAVRRSQRQGVQDSLVRDLNVFVVGECVLCVDELLSLSCWGDDAAGVARSIDDFVDSSRLSPSARRRLEVVLPPAAAPLAARLSPTVIVVPLRLGGDRFNAATYVTPFKKLLASRHSVGALGGRPKRSLYVVGWHNDAALCLDPHYCHRAVHLDAAAASSSTFPVQSFFCSTPQEMAFADMDPSCALGFYVPNATVLVEFLIHLLDVCTFGIGDADACKQPLFSVLYSRDELMRPVAKRVSSRSLKAASAETRERSTDSCASSTTSYEVL